MYIEKGIYIIEQGEYSYFTGAAFRLNVLLILHAVFLRKIDHFFRGKLINIKMTISLNEINPNRLINNIYIKSAFFISLLLISLSYINIIITGNIPIFSSGYISRFDYLQTTVFWNFLAPFGSTVVMVPIISGYIFLISKMSNKRTFANSQIFLLILYLIYLILIGQKFGGIIFGVYYFCIPTFVYFIINNKKVITKKNILILLGTILLAFSLVVYHYSNYALVEQFGGPLAFILYRALGLQGHTWWGIDNQLMANNEYFVSSKFNFNMMEGIMLAIGNNDVETAIERGVNFTFGLYPGLIMNFGYLNSLIILIFLSFLFYVVIYIVLYSIKNGVYFYFLSAYLYITFYNFISIGNFKVFFEIKTLLILYIVLLLYLISAKKRYVKFRGIRDLG
ncbi:DUF6418 domain-containing protein [Bacillus sp. DTU_2020_1000418_1_SI_GHA_SEK_038]|uniref:DUF6418 domain-containing protein n=1 Tax=Bacillus sp. DTU_2020_1000418_1_SI_GHA_SEK_038 TaxID=3077585 RepID=UPI0028E40EAF|nr:DUF6418 domain-containing protein [Bacillus sp. DTU_2020_1000418_1_SI_GHA_SEK_038]WNS75205.1 DUF6418 domain-containing protein [Bacillus sp. DTU_2020_1000418_1_SI_GHA_SEK_038]